MSTPITIGIMPIFFQRIHGAVFADGASLSQAHDERYRLSAGAELRMDFILGHMFQATFRAGLALPVKPEDDVRIIMGFAEIF